MRKHWEVLVLGVFSQLNYLLMVIDKRIWEMFYSTVIRKLNAGGVLSTSVSSVFDDIGN